MEIASSGQLAVITGAAGGLGTAFAHKLAERGYHLLLVDKRYQQLEDLCQDIAARHGVTAEPYAIDLTDRTAVQELAARLRQADNVELLVNNAGFGTLDYFVDTDADCLVDMVDLHVVAPVMLTRAVLPRMIERNRGSVINVSSLSAWFQSAGNVQYGSTKCCLAVLSNSLQQELQGTNVRVQALCPGFVRTEFHTATSMTAFNLRKPPAERWWMSAESVVEYSLRALNGKRVIVFPRLEYRIVGRLAQMPLLQPLMQWIAKWPRASTKANEDVAVSANLIPTSEMAENP